MSTEQTSAPVYGATKKSFIIVSLLLVLMLAGCGDALQRVYLQGRQTQVDQAVGTQEVPTRFVVEPGTPARAIGQELAAAGLIADARLFEAYVRVNRLSARLEAGTFVLSPTMTLREIVQVLQEARAESIRVTIPEGWRVEQVGDYLAEAELFSAAELASFREQTISGQLVTLSPADFPFLADRPAGASLEGYLFPDTYFIPATDTTAADLLQRQLTTFAERVLPLYEAARQAGTTPYTLHEVLTIASIVEREAVVPTERPAIAGVYLNRLANGIRLEADPTVQYAMGYQSAADQWWKTPVFLEEYSSVESPYNTYLNAGIPPGPIASPGLSSIEAVLTPAEHNYLFFVALPDGSGAHVFAETFEEHSVNVRQYLGQ